MTCQILSETLLFLINLLYLYEFYDLYFPKPIKTAHYLSFTLGNYYTPLIQRLKMVGWKYPSGKTTWWEKIKLDNV